MKAKASQALTTSDRCAALDAQLDSAIARGSQTGPAHQALENNERLSLQNTGCPAESATALTTSTSASSVEAGTPIHDTATLSGDDPGGQITFAVFMGDCSGSGTAVPPPAVVSGEGSYDSGSFTPTAPGSYSFQATYGGDANNPALTSACEPFMVTRAVIPPANPTLTTQTASSSVTAGAPFSDSATLSGGSSPTGQIGFTLFHVTIAGHDCTNSGVGTPVATVNVTSGNGTYSSGPFTINTPGQYSMGAFYNGDANNNSATSACEPFTVTGGTT